MLLVVCYVIDLEIAMFCVAWFLMFLAHFCIFIYVYSLFHWPMQSHYQQYPSIVALVLLVVVVLVVVTLVTLIEKSILLARRRSRRRRKRRRKRKRKLRSILRRSCESFGSTYISYIAIEKACCSFVFSHYRLFLLFIVCTHVLSKMFFKQQKL